MTSPFEQAAVDPKEQPDTVPTTAKELQNDYDQAEADRLAGDPGEYTFGKNPETDRIIARRLGTLGTPSEERQRHPALEAQNLSDLDNRLKNQEGYQNPETGQEVSLPDVLSSIENYRQQETAEMRTTLVERLGNAFVDRLDILKAEDENTAALRASRQEIAGIYRQMEAEQHPPAPPSIEPPEDQTRFFAVVPKQPKPTLFSKLRRLFGR